MFVQNLSLEVITSKWGFLIETIQLSLQENLVPVANTRYWTTEPFKTKYFNDYIFYSLRENILKRVIVNGMSWSSWRFRRFIYLNFKNSKFRKWNCETKIEFIDFEATTASDNEVGSEDEVRDVDYLKSSIDDDDKTEIEEDRTIFP